MAILVITMVDLQCCRCRAKITKVLESLKGEFSIEKIEFDDKLSKVIVRGKFDGEKLKTTILCKAGKIVKEVELVEKWPPPAKPPPPKPECKVVSFPYPVPYPFSCKSWPCPPPQPPCQCCNCKPTPPPPPPPSPPCKCEHCCKPPPPPPPPPPPCCKCEHCSHENDGCKPCPPCPPNFWPPQPWPYHYQCPPQDSQCSIM